MKQQAIDLYEKLKIEWNGKNLGVCGEYLAQLKVIFCFYFLK